MASSRQRKWKQNRRIHHNSPTVVKDVTNVLAPLVAAWVAEHNQDLKEKSAVELRDIARDRGIRGFSKMNKTQLVDALLVPA